MRVLKHKKRTKFIKGMGLELKEKKKSSARISMPSGGGRATDDDPISSLIAKKPKKSGRKQTSRKTRTKTRKPKYLSLRLQFSTTERSQESSEMPSSTISSTTTSRTASSKNSGSKQLNLFPLHPDNLVEEKEVHDENMAYLFSVADGGASTLTGLLESATNTSSSDQQGDNNQNNDSSGTTTLSPTGSLTYAYQGRQEEDGRDQEVALVRTALRNKEREPSEERWVRYSEVVERRDDQEVSSCAAPDMGWRNQRLSLKLDYEEILSAWSDKGSLFIRAYTAPPQSPQTVPDIHDDFRVSPIIPSDTISLSHGWGNDGGCVWRVPEFTISQENDQQGVNLVKVKTEEQQEQGVVGGGEDQWRMGQREASVKRYKEKRQNRLFSKRIRYQVRKINAEKRPRLKGRFVKRS